MYHLPRTFTFAMNQEIHPLLQSPALRQIELSHAHLPLMERAGSAAFELAVRLLQDRTAQVLILVGPGNNGGDALVAARLLREKGFTPCVVLASDPEHFPADARNAFLSWQASGGTCHTDVPKGLYGLIIDGLFGIGLTRPIEGIYAEWIQAINQFPGPVLALDCPSGLNADTGMAPGPTVKASHTLTFIARKPGLYTLEGPDHCGHISVASLGLEAAVQTASQGRLLDQETGVQAFIDQLPRRALNSHKGSHGSVGIIGGAPGMAGAALLAGRSALMAGAGRVYIGMQERLAVDPQQAELMLRQADEVFDLATTLAIGPGLGASHEALDLLRRAIDCDKPLLIDADGLNLLAAHPALHRHVARRSVATVLTPHPLEAARLLDQGILAVQSDRISAAQRLARQFNAEVVLKGAGSVLAAPNGQWAINGTGNPGLATAGTGDVLSGFIVALLAQGCPAHEALAAAVHLHGLAADLCVAGGQGPLGLTALELLIPARRQLNEWVSQH